MGTNSVLVRCVLGTLILAKLFVDHAQQRPTGTSPWR